MSSKYTGVNGQGSQPNTREAVACAVPIATSARTDGEPLRNSFFNQTCLTTSHET